MYSIFEIIAVAIAVIATLVVIVRVFDSVKSRLACREEIRFRRRLAREYGLLGREIANAASWFSEDAPTMKLLEDIGWHIADNECVLAVDLRDRWREERAKSDSQKA